MNIECLARYLVYEEYLDNGIPAPHTKAVFITKKQKVQVECFPNGTFTINGVYKELKDLPKRVSIISIQH